MKKNGSKKYFILAIITVLLVFNALLFLLTKKENYTTSFWVAYGFISFAFLGFLLTSLLAKEGKTGMAYIYPVITVAGIYLMIVFLLALIVFIFPKMSVKTVLVMMILVTGISLVVYIFALMNREIIERESLKKSLMFKINDVYPVLEGIILQTSDQQLKDQIAEVATMSLNALASEREDIFALDKRIFEYVQFVEKNVRRNEINNVYQNLGKVKELLILRERTIAKE